MFLHYLKCYTDSLLYVLFYLYGNTELSLIFINCSVHYKRHVYLVWFTFVDKLNIRDASQGREQMKHQLFYLKINH